jgi:hypothetical protein
MRISQLPIETIKTDASGLSSGMHQSVTQALAIRSSRAVSDVLFITDLENAKKRWSAASTVNAKKVRSAEIVARRYLFT